MVRIGGWSDLAAYYADTEGNAWAFQGGWTNQGPVDPFMERVRTGRIRGELETQVRRCPGCGCEEPMIHRQILCRDCGPDSAVILNFSASEI